MLHLILAGGGHAHVIMLEHLIKHPCAKLQVGLISPTKKQAYSGMLPGWVNNTYALEACQIDLQQLCIRAGAVFISGKLAGLDTKQQQVILDDQRLLDYDLVSLAMGSQPNQFNGPSSSSHWVAMKPFANFTQQWHTWQQHLNPNQAATLTIAGGGAGAVEIALAARQVMPCRDLAYQRQIIIYAGPKGVMNGFSHRTRGLILKSLQQAEIRVINEYIDVSKPLHQQAPNDFYLLITSAKPGLSLHASELALDAFGFVLVDEFQRSISHSNVFAAGDICSRPSTFLQRSGVHAIRAGKQLAHNLLAACHSNTLQPYWPRRHNLYLISCSDQTAVGSYGINLGFFSINIALRGRWLWLLKNHIDLKFVSRFKSPKQ